MDGTVEADRGIFPPQEAIKGDDQAMAIYPYFVVQAQHLDPRAPWLYNFKLDFRFK